MNIHSPIEGKSSGDGKSPIEGKSFSLSADQAKPRKSRWRYLGWSVLPLIAIAVAYVVMRAGTPPPAAAEMPPVTVATPLQREVTEWDTYIGRFEASRAVEVRPRVSGQITELHFTDGQPVEEGAPLFTIDPRPFEATLAQARAGVAAAKSDLELAKTDLGRAERLIDSHAVSQSELDRLRARAQVAAANLAAAKAEVRAAALDVEFTTVRAPISGRVSDRRIDVGNLVSASKGADGTLLTTINSLDPIYFTFEGSEALYLKARRRGADAGSPVEIRLQDETDYNWQGALDFVDNGLNPRSGTIRARAVLDNPDLFLTPGMFGKMRLSSNGSQMALLVPDTAVQTDQAQKVLLVVADDGTVRGKPVVLGPVIDGLRVVRAGLVSNDLVVIKGVQMAFPGMQVQTEPGEITPVTREAVPLTTMSLPGEATFTR
ncbi:efflux RND transporter periplasmic adaptor subunit [Emcibacter sp.]|uniref:efflux RND transporter periplasmic adaptor subunit n=1 Tax=Emcibacter sp. TaxID=1979954 RepID=UPI003A94CA6A